MGYRLNYTYNTNGLPTEVEAASPITQLAGAPARQPNENFTYDGYGDIATYNAGSGSWTLTYDSSNRLITVQDPDLVAFHTCYYANGQVEFKQSALQNSMDGGTACGAHSVSYTYDSDGDVVTTAHHYTCVKNQSCTAGITTQWYDGDDRLVQVQQPQDPSDVYSNPWLTRYIYDISQAGTLGSIGVSGVSGMTAHGNLFDTQELLASGAPQWTYPTKLTNATWLDTAATQFDGLDRPTNKYQYVSDTPRNEAITYDATSYLGELTKDCNALSVCKSFKYDNAGRPWEVSYSDSTPTEDTGFDANGRVASVNSSIFGMQAYIYDADGNKKSAYDPTSGGVTGASELSYTYYPDGKRSSLSVVAEGSGSTSRPNMLVYAYQTDGAMSTQQINLPDNAKVGTTTLKYTYSSADRLKTRTETGPGANTYPITYTYDSTGEMATADFPTTNGTSATFSYDAEGDMETFGGTNFQYSDRGELLYDPRGNNTIHQAYANGVKDATDGETYSWDARRGALISAADTGIDGGGSSFGYDNAGRMTGGSNNASSTNVTSYTRSFDGENHLIGFIESGEYNNNGYTVTIGYDWGPNGHPIRVGSTPLASSAGGATPSPQPTPLLSYETLHWDGNQVLFTTNNSGTIDDIKVGDIGDVTPLDPSYTGITFWDRVAGSIAYCHNATGTAGVGGTSSWHSGKVSAQLSPCFGPKAGTTLPSTPEYLSSVSLGSAQGANYVGVGQGGLLFMPGSDGINDGMNTVQGVRSYDPVAGTWTTPDAYAGEVHDPASQKKYAWNRNNPTSFSDPTGFDAALFYDAQPQSGDAIQDAPDVGSGGAWIASDTDTTTYATLDDAAKAANSAYSDLNKGHEVGCAVYCTGGKNTCHFGPASVGDKDVGDYGMAPVDLGPYKGDKDIAIWHRHPEGADRDTTTAHAEAVSQIYREPGLRWLQNQSLTIYTLLPDGLYYQYYAGPVMAADLVTRNVDVPANKVP